MCPSKTAETKSLSDLSYDLIVSGYSVTGVANIVLNYARTMTDSKLGYVSVLDPVTRNNICHTLTGMIGDSCHIAPGSKGIVFARRPDGTYPALWGHSLNTRESFFTNAPDRHRGSTGLPADHMPIDRFLSVPVMLDGDLLGQISLANAPTDYTDGDLASVNSIAVIFAHCLKRLNLEPVQPAPHDANGMPAADRQNGPPRSIPEGDIQHTISRNIQRLATPYIEQLKQTELTGTQRFFLQRLQESLEGTSSLLLANTSRMHVSFTPQEFQVAIMIKSGLKTKEIAEQLDISINAINFHRKNIRKKLAISHKQVNLQTYLSSLEDW